MDFSGRSLQESLTVDTCSASVYEAFWKNFTRFIREGGLGSDPREGPNNLRRAILAAFYGLFRTPSVWT